MIILRYLSKEILQSTFAVTSVLLLIIMSGRFIRYLAEAAAGKMDANVLFAIMYYRLPGFLELILPLGFFISLLLAYGRLYTDSEMTVLYACGISRKKVIGWTYIPAGFIAIITALLSLWLSPLGLQKAEEIIAEQQARNDLETMQPAKFQLLSDRRFVSYSETVQKDPKRLENFFLAKMNVGQEEALMTLKAQSAENIINEEVNQPYLLLKQGVRYEGRPGQPNYRVTEFQGLAQYVSPPKEIVVTRNAVNRLPTAELLASDKPDYQAALQWRLSSPLLVLIITILGVMFSHSSPRRGRYAMLFPAILLYLVYLVMLNAARGAVEEQRLLAWIGLWSIHSVFIVLSCSFLIPRQWWTRLRRGLGFAKPAAPVTGT